MPAEDRPVLVIHGVANRSFSDFRANVDSLQEGVGPNWRLIPVYWGDLGAPIEGIEQTVPSRDSSRDARLSDDLESLLVDGQREVDEARATGLALIHRSRAGVRATLEAVGASASEIVAAAAISRLHELGVGNRDDDVRSRLSESGAQLDLIASVADEATLRALGVTIAERYVGLVSSTGAASLEIVGPIDWITHAINGTLDAVVGGIAGAIDRAGEALNTWIRTWVLLSLGTGIGDVFIYEGNQAAIQGRVAQCLVDEARGWGTAERPIPILGHSLGGIIAFDLAVRENDPISIDPLVTFGSQSAVIEIFDPRPKLQPPYHEGSRVDLPGTIGHWHNVWSPLDPLAFSAANIFRTDPVNRVEDIRLAFVGGTDLFTHDSYWDDPVLHAEARRALEGVHG